MEIRVKFIYLMPEQATKADEEIMRTGLKVSFHFVLALICLFGLVIGGGALFFITTPRPTNLRGCLTTTMFHVHLCPKDASYVRLRDISRNLKGAVIVSEDGGFYGHQGVDWFEMRESFEKNLEKGAFARGGSTITQQLAKNVYLSQEKSLLRKAREIIIALQIEDLLSKDEILEKYLNVVEFGPNLYGAKAASEFYFKKSPSDLSAAEGAFLAFLLPSPDRYSKSYRQGKLSPFARSQMKKILSRMAHYNKISEEEYSQALHDVATFFGQPEDPSDQNGDDLTDETGGEPIADPGIDESTSSSHHDEREAVAQHSRPTVIHSESQSDEAPSSDSAEASPQDNDNGSSNE